MFIPVCPNTFEKTKSSVVTTGQLPFNNITIAMLYACGGTLFSDSNKYCHICPDCGAGWVEYETITDANLELKKVEELLAWHPPLEFAAKGF